VAAGAPELAAGVRSSGMSEREQLLDELRPVAFAIAYRMLGGVSEAEDIAPKANPSGLRKATSSSSRKANGMARKRH
jgi:DNA-directed RNA polymerase specialized sigma24 family protein